MRPLKLMSVALLLSLLFLAPTPANAQGSRKAAPSLPAWSALARICAGVLKVFPTYGRLGPGMDPAGSTPIPPPPESGGGSTDPEDPEAVAFPPS